MSHDWCVTIAALGGIGAGGLAGFYLAMALVTEDLCWWRWRR